MCTHCADEDDDQHTAKSENTNELGMSRILLDKRQDDGNSSRDDLAKLVVYKILTTVMQESFVRCRKRMQLQDETDMNLVK